MDEPFSLSDAEVHKLLSETAAALEAVSTAAATLAAETALKTAAQTLTGMAKALSEEGGVAEGGATH